MAIVEASNLEVEVGLTEEEVVVRLAGDLDVSTVPALRACIDELEPHDGVTVLDVASLDFVDSAGVSCLFRLHQRVADGGGMLVARGTTPQIRRVLEMTQLTRLIAVVD